jgi:hypothetical protein
VVTSSIRQNDLAGLRRLLYEARGCIFGRQCNTYTATGIADFLLRPLLGDAERLSGESTPETADFVQCESGVRVKQGVTMYIPVIRWEDASVNDSGQRGLDFGLPTPFDSPVVRSWRRWDREEGFLLGGWSQRDASSIDCRTVPWRIRVCGRVDNRLRQGRSPPSHAVVYDIHGFAPCQALGQDRRTAGD